MKDRVAAVRAALRPETERGDHGHPNLVTGVAHAIAAAEAGAHRIDAAAAGLGAGVGDTPMALRVAVCGRMVIETGVVVGKLQDVAEARVVPTMEGPIRIDRDGLTLGWAGVEGPLPAVGPAGRKGRRRARAAARPRRRGRPGPAPVALAWSVRRPDGGA